jgi:hypothetical protein
MPGNHFQVHSQRARCRLDVARTYERHLHRGLALALSLGEATEPVQYSPAEPFLFS